MNHAFAAMCSVKRAVERASNAGVDPECDTWVPLDHTVDSVAQSVYEAILSASLFARNAEVT